MTLVQVAVHALLTGVTLLVPDRKSVALVLDRKSVILVPVLVLPQNYLVPDQVALLALHQKSVVLVPDQAAQDPMVLATLVQEYVLRQAFRSES